MHHRDLAQPDFSRAGRPVAASTSADAKRPGNQRSGEQVPAKEARAPVQVRIEKPPMRFGFDVYLFDHQSDGQTVVYNLDGSVRETVAPGSGVPEPSFHLDEQILAGLLREGSDVLPPSAAQAKHLADAVKVRDRLLDLVEHGVNVHAQVCRSAAAEIEARDCPTVGEADKSAVVRKMRKALRLQDGGES